MVGGHLSAPNVKVGQNDYYSENEDRDQTACVANPFADAQAEERD